MRTMRFYPFTYVGHYANAAGNLKTEEEQGSRCMCRLLPTNQVSGYR
jgi:hypothetical protein